VYGSYLGVDGLVLFLTFLLLLTLLLVGIPIAVSIGVTTAAIMFLVGGLDMLVMLPSRMYAISGSFTLLAVPFFILAANLMNAGATTDAIYKVANLLVGRTRGGLGQVNVVGSMIFSGMSGSAVADAAGLGRIEIREMIKRGYKPGFAAAITASSAPIGAIIPPSVPFVVFGSMAGVSVSALFLAGILPGLLMGAVLMVSVAYFARVQNLPVSENRPPFRECVSTIFYATPAIIMPVLVVGSIITGIATPTEAATIASIYALIVGIYFYRGMQWRDLPKVFWESARQTAQLTFIVAAANAFGWVLIQQQVPRELVSWALALSDTPWLILLIINLVLLFFGMFVEGLALIIIAGPMLLPMTQAIGMDPVHFGVMFVLNILIGLVTPPVGIILFVVAEISKVSVWTVVRENWLYLIALMLTLIIVTYVPAVSLFLPRLFGF